MDCKQITRHELDIPGTSTTDLHCKYHFRIISPPHFIIVNIIFM